ncbi:Uncharacterized protein HZ326_11404 [Fusarium oxysporum f. sp. albedinis]|nr:Uncharacterized protein HZ326_11404 [Fusarium oxysporum f. sp. albedinis]
MAAANIGFNRTVSVRSLGFRGELGESHDEQQRLAFYDGKLHNRKARQTIQEKRAVIRARTAFLWQRANPQPGKTRHCRARKMLG